MMDPVHFKSLILLYMESLEERRGFKKKKKEIYANSIYMMQFSYTSAPTKFVMVWKRRKKRRIYSN